MASIARRPDGTYRPRYRDENGKEHARHFKRKVDAQRWLDEQTAALVRGDWVDPKRGRSTFRAYVETWLPAQPLRDSSRRAYDSYLRNHLLPTFGDKRLSAVTRTQVLAFRRGIEAKLSPTTSRQMMALLAGIFADAVEDGFLAKSPCRDTVPPRPHREKVVPLTVEQVAALVDAAPDRWEPLIEHIGRVGYVAKGIAFGLVGVLLWRAATSADVTAATGLDGAMTAVAGVTAGPWLLAGIATGFAAFGVYALARARYPDRDPSS